MAGSSTSFSACDGKPAPGAGWDSEWYRRVYFDDGTLLGSAANPECQIDSLSQSWEVLSGAGNTQRASPTTRRRV